MSRASSGFIRVEAPVQCGGGGPQNSALILLQKKKISVVGKGSHAVANPNHAKSGTGEGIWEW